MKIRVFFCLITALITYRGSAQITKVSGPAGSGDFGHAVTILSNGNYVIGDPTYDEGGRSNIGAVYLYNGQNHQLISKAVGSSVNDRIGSNGVTALPNGNFVILSSSWSNGSAASAGAVTWVDGTSGLNGEIGSSNSITGTKAYDFVGGSPILVLPTGNFLIGSPNWDSGKGAFTFVNGSSGLAGEISAVNSLVGSSAGDQLGYTANVTILPDGNYVITVPYWDNGAALNAGAAVICDGSSGVSGAISASNALVGTKTADFVGIGGVTVLTNGNFVISSAGWGNGPAAGAGAVTWVKGGQFPVGALSAGNSLVGTNESDGVGSTGPYGNYSASGVVGLPGGNYAVISGNWKNGSLLGAGAVTWCNGHTGRVGAVSTANSLVGGRAGDGIGNSGITVLTNGNYLIASQHYNGFAGAVTWASGTQAITGTVGSSNSLLGSSANDHVGLSVKALPNGNYVVNSPFWNNGSVEDAGAATWGNGLTGITGIIGVSNSIVGTAANSKVGDLVTPLTNGHYVISSSTWSDNVNIYSGAVTWLNGSTPTSGTVNAGNSLIGNSYDYIWKVFALTNGNYVVAGDSWTENGENLGAVTLCNGSSGTIGKVSRSNSIVGHKSGDRIGDQGVLPLKNGNFLIYSKYWSEGSYRGAITWANGTGDLSGTVNMSNSLVGGAGDIGEIRSTIALPNGDYIIQSPYWGTASAWGKGAITFGNGSTGISGAIGPHNSFVGSFANDNVGNTIGLSSSIEILPNGSLFVNTANWNSTNSGQRGAVSFFKSADQLLGTVTSCNSVTGSSSAFKSYGYNSIHGYALLGARARNAYTIYAPDGIGPALAESGDAVTTMLASGEASRIISEEGCRDLTLVESTGSNPVTGNINSKVWVESEIKTYGGSPFVARHYEINPSQQAASATGKVTLYFTQAEFDEFNSHSGSLLNLPTTGVDDEGKANLRVGKFSGVSSDNSGLPETYGSKSEDIDPLDEDVRWNESMGRWEISFGVTGFSGFFVYAGTTPLPVKLVSFTGESRENNTVLQWKISDPENFDRFELERSFDGSKFENFARVGFLAGKNSYNAIDSVASKLIKNYGVIYYRLKMIDLDRSFAFSKIVSVEMKSKAGELVFVYPNPFNHQFSISLAEYDGKAVTVYLRDTKGRLVLEKEVVVQGGLVGPMKEIDEMPAGKYLLSIKCLNEVVSLKLMKDR